MAKLWAGRTDGATDQLADDFNSSIRFDHVMYKQDITGSMAHAAMLGAQGIITQAEATQLIDGLQGVLDDLDSGDVLLILILLFLFRDGDDIELMITLGLILLLGLGEKDKDADAQKA